ncbi:MAG: 50S ribosomal protein L3 [SAR324 cluster bacterium]|nr:50S ribosomal protein L3 [SAR324 cluster bacterium]MCZ6844168.1 50S ribosomal protein L3 [SAR324 cluster bacterium]
MLQGMLGRKIGMTQIFNESGECIPVTVVEVGPVTVVQIKTLEKDGYESVQVGYQPITKEKQITKPMQGHFKDTAPTRHLKEFKVHDLSQVQVGQSFDLTIFSEGEKVQVRGLSKGKGFQGVIKRHGFKGGPESHGSRFHRSPGSIGNRTFPGRVFPGKRMPGHMGAEMVTVRNLEIQKVIPEKNLLLIKGAIPSHNGALVEVRKPKTP